MSDRLEFDIVCPNDHNQTVKFSEEEFEAALKSGALVFHCNTCDTNWPPSKEEIAGFRKAILEKLKRSDFIIEFPVCLELQDLGTWRP